MSRDGRKRKRANKTKTSHQPVLTRLTRFATPNYHQNKMGGIELSRKQEGGDAQLGKKTEESKTSEKRARLFWPQEEKKSLLC